jgi:hypothetical protein
MKGFGKGCYGCNNQIFRQQLLYLYEGLIKNHFQFTVMVTEAKKLHIIEEVLKINNEAALSALEGFIQRSKKSGQPDEKPSFKEFSGIWSKEEADEIERIIAESCENIHPDDWK